MRTVLVGTLKMSATQLSKRWVRYVFNFVSSFNDSREKKATNKQKAETKYKYSQIK